MTMINFINICAELKKEKQREELQKKESGTFDKFVGRKYFLHILWKIKKYFIGVHTFFFVFHNKKF